MASNIVPDNIDGDFPVAGIDNDSQGFRTNFTNTVDNFTQAKAEIEDLQAKVVLKSALTGESTVDNDMLGVELKAPKLIDSRETIFAHSTVSGTVSIDHQNGHYQTLTTTGPITLAFTNFPGTPGTPVLGRVRLEMTIADTAHTVTLPGTATNGVDFIDGYVAGVVTFSAAGTYVFEIYTSDSTTYTVNDITRKSAPASAGIFNVVEDTSPQLGGNLDVQASSITTSVTNGNVTITPDGTGNIQLGNFVIDGDQVFGAAQDKYALVYDNSSGVISLESPGQAHPLFKSYSATQPDPSTQYIGGFYLYDAADTTLTIGGTVTQVFGTANASHASHAFIVAGGPGGGTDLVLTVTGTSITDAGVRTPADSEILIGPGGVFTSFADSVVLNQYIETDKKWLGQVTYTLTGTAGGFTFNYGLCKYEDFGNRDFTITDFEATGHAGVTETAFDIELLHHESTAFVYNATTFVPNQTPLVSLSGIHSTDDNVPADEYFAFKRAQLSNFINGADSEGVMIRTTTVVNNSIDYMNLHIGVTFGS